MADRQPDPYSQVLAAYAVMVGLLLLVLLVSPFFLIGLAVVIAWRVHRAYLNSPARLARVAATRSADLYAQAEALRRSASFPAGGDFADRLWLDLVEIDGVPQPTPKLQTTLLALADYLYDREGFVLENVPKPPVVGDAIAHARYQDLISPLIGKLSLPNAEELARKAIAESIVAVLRRLPPIALRPSDKSYYDGPEGPFAVPLIDSCEDVGAIIDALVLPFYGEELKASLLFADLRAQIDHNLRTASGIEHKYGDARKLIFPSDRPGSPREVVDTYLRHTELGAIFDVMLPFCIDTKSRMEHWHLVAGSGHGKTQTLQHIIATDLTSERPPALVIVDSQGDMLRKLECLEFFEAADKLVVIDPEDESSPALNMFDVRSDRLSGYSRTIREQVEAGIVELFNYVFGALASDLTAKQGTAFAYITRLMLSIPGATIHTFRELMETTDPSKFADPIAKLDPTARAFFTNQFFNKTAFGETRQQIARRLYTVLQVPAFERMFAACGNKLDMFEAMQAGKVVLINTAKSLLKADASALFGRYMIALTLNAAFERVALPEGQRQPAYLIVDEAAEYFDANLERLLAQARKFGLGILFAHQHLDQLSPLLRSAVAANTSVKMAGGVSNHDARALAPDMRTTPDFISATRKHEDRTEFACYVRNRTDSAVRLSIPFGTLERLPRMREESRLAMRELNRQRYGITGETTAREPEPLTAPRPESAARRDPDDIDMQPSES